MGFPGSDGVGSNHANPVGGSRCVYADCGTIRIRVAVVRPHCVVYHAGPDSCVRLQGKARFISPRRQEHQLSNSAGLIYNFKVENVDREYEKILHHKLNIVIPIENHPWGDRGFGIQDPNGITVYVYSDIEPTEEFRKFYK